MTRTRAFTIIEILVVIAIIGILISLVVVAVVPIQERSRDARRKADINMLLAALNQFHVDYKVFPNYTFILGTSAAPGERVSYFDLGAAMVNCANFGPTMPGHPSSFVQGKDLPVGGEPGTATNFSSPADYNNYVLRPGFRAVNHFLICLNYIDRLIVDPRPANNHTDYQYQVSHNYQNILVSSRLENANDPAAVERLFATVPGSVMMSPRRYFEGNGRLTWQFDEGTDGTIAADGSLSPNVVTNGRYFYQCRLRADGTTITRDDRSLTRYRPFNNLSVLNSACRRESPGTGENVPTN